MASTKKMVILIGINSFIFLLVTWLLRDQSNQMEIPVDQNRPPEERAQPTITPVLNSKHFMVSAFKDHRQSGAVRVISILCREELKKKLYCAFCANATAEGSVGPCTSSEAWFDIHRNNFPYATASVMCPSPSSPGATHVSITNDPNNIHNLKFLPIQNQEAKNSYKYNFIWCISNIFGKSNNALQFVQTMELYRIMGVQRVVIYNTSCGPDIEKAFKYYQKEGILEVVPWPIDKFLKPSGSWRPDYSPGEIHYYGQVTTLNDCIYRYMYESKYLVLNDLDEFIMPYKHASLGDLMGFLQERYSDAAIFRFWNYVYPNTQSDDSGRYPLPQWKNVPGVSILEHIYREPENADSPISAKLIVDPRRVEQTIVHQTQKQFGRTIEVPTDIGHLMHIRHPKEKNFSKDQLTKDKRLWDFETKLISRTNQALFKSGLL
ncbi:hypothetical protein ACEWY4_014770 [Coilia grayii]|uniref:Glycosyltransferase family 92 protein n=1 Tax=Coilia grayii TaxID=363190 RepID=A0ABD1JTA5_9TELE